MKKVFMKIGPMTRKEARRKNLAVVSYRIEKGGVIILFIVKLGFAEMTVSKKITTTRRIVGMMTGNPYFVDPTVALIDVTTKVDALEVAEEALPGSPAATSLRNTLEAELDELMRRLQAYVEDEAKGNRDIILSSGFEVRDPSTPIGILPAPEWLVGKNAAVSGDVKLKWKAVKKRTYYRVEWTTDPEGSWNYTTCTKASLTLSGLTPGERYYFRVATVSVDGFYGYCDIVNVRINLA